MKLTIIVSDNAVYVDGINHLLDLSTCTIPTNIHALQWKNNTGWIEFTSGEDGVKLANESITELPVWANKAANKWNEAKAAEEAAAIALEKVKNQPTA